MELGLALRAVERQQIYLSPAISHKAIERRADQRFEDHIDVTPRQRQVLELIGRGKSTKEIASLMGISVKTVETHRARSDERRVGKGCVSTWRSWWSPYH